MSIQSMRKEKCTLEFEVIFVIESPISVKGMMIETQTIQIWKVFKNCFVNHVETIVREPQKRDTAIYR